MPGPAYTVRTPRLLLRCWDPADAPLYRQALGDSREHLLPWLPWVRDEPRSLDDQVARLRGLRALFDMGRDFIYGAFAAEGGELVGSVGLHPRAGEGAREISLWTTARHAGSGYGTEASVALLRVAFEVDEVRRVELHCDPRNHASRHLAAKLGFEHEATLRARDEDEHGAPADVMIWSLFREGYAASRVARADVEAFDAMGRRLL
jgi:RimJ/RimL family protein N-acetyltransferase